MPFKLNYAVFFSSLQFYQKKTLTRIYFLTNNGKIDKTKILNRKK